MWKVESNKAYPFRHKHANHFPPSPSSGDILAEEGEGNRWSYQLSPTPFSDEEEEEEEVPIFFRSPSEEQERRIILSTQTMSPSRLPAAQQPNWPLIPPPLLALPPPPPPPRAPTPPPLHISTQRHKPKPRPLPPTRPLLLPPNLSPFSEPPTPSSQAPQTLTGLLTDVLSIMNSIMSQQALVASENELLEDLTELVVILQEEAEEMLAMADLVEEFVEEVEVGEVVGGLEVWAGELGLGLGIGGVGGDGDGEGEWEEEYGGGGRERERDGRCGHEREESFDSGVGMEMSEEVREERDRDGHVGELRLSLYRPKEAGRRAEDSGGRLKEIENGRRSKRDKKEATMSRELVKVDRGEMVLSSKPKKDRQRGPPLQFRDSGLELLSPQNSPKRNRSSTKPRWI
ncbi:uncharacterized protein LY89DRAFT_733513 [Mollisia scopiformis]|uniref:Uncharacterized protein n=1 Tax=Mollisia scopiformis TaxID=149040 RepID=A0A194XBZ2_MOLSC|nr:uncharacterized protein LY89DRAFT_733513 [Mollisia scopiformis]KUJ17680.1 hypothetical protein LY89DRAFT_733513 [Mollisia scopiformis]